MSKLTDIYTQKILLREHGEEIDELRPQSEEKREVQIAKSILSNLNHLHDFRRVPTCEAAREGIRQLAHELLKIHGVQ